MSTLSTHEVYGIPAIRSALNNDNDPYFLARNALDELESVADEVDDLKSELAGSLEDCIQLRRDIEELNPSLEECDQDKPENFLETQLENKSLSNTVDAYRKRHWVQEQEIRDLERDLKKLRARGPRKPKEAK
jgi:phage shock protein A